MDRKWTTLRVRETWKGDPGSARGGAPTCPPAGGLVFKAHGLLYPSTLGLRVEEKKKRVSPCLASAPWRTSEVQTWRNLGQEGGIEGWQARAVHRSRELVEHEAGRTLYVCVCVCVCVCV